MNMKINIGCQGWNYVDWISRIGEDIFYPRGTRAGEMLEIYSRVFRTIEVDSTFYAIPSQSSIESWYQKSTDDFVFSLKLPQEITHEKGLREDSYQVLDEFCERVAGLKEKLGAVLIQFAPQFEANKENARNLRQFLERLPEEIRFAVEFRNRDWFVEWTFEELSKHGVALCLVEGSWIPREKMFEAIEKPTADFSYVRWMGERDLTSFDRIVRPQDANLAMWKAELEKMKVEEIYAYFSNFYEGYAPASVEKMLKLFGQEVVEIESLENQGSLF